MTEPGTAEAPWLAQPERGVVPLIKAMVWIALRLGRPVGRLLLYPVCAYYLAFSAATRAASRAYLAKALRHEPSLRDVFRHLHSFAACVLDRVFLLNDQIDLFDLRIHGEDIFTDIIASGRGCFLLGAHVGSFEVLRTLGRRRPDVRVSLVMYEENARKTNAALNAINPALQMDVISLGHPQAMLQVEERLDRGDFVGILADRGLDNEAQVKADFLGEPASFPTGPFRMTALMKRPVVLMFGLYRGGNRYDVHFELFTPSPAASPGDRAEPVQSALRRYVERVEHYCRLAPYNWFNFYDFWK